MPLASRTILGGLIRLVHPFPILLDGIVVGAVAVVAGGDGMTALRLGVAMIALQASIGSLNDLVDAPIDGGRTPAKPIPVGLVRPVWARAVVVGSAVLGFVLTAPSGGWLLALAGLGLGIGYAYDLAAKGTAWSWVPFAIGIPLLPVFGWFGASRSLPAPFAIVIPVAVMAGAALAIANASADVAHDRATARSSVAIRLGPARAWAVVASLQVAVGAIAIGSLSATGRNLAAIVAAILAMALVLIGVGLGRSRARLDLERAWEVQAIGVALLGVSWLWGIAAPG